MMFLWLFTALSIVKVSLQHGYMIDPPSRSSLWRVNDKVPPNYDDNRLYCGGRAKIQQLGGLCGPCGDPYDGERENEAGGRYALGIISKQLPDGADILETKVVNTAFHEGYYEFRICANNDTTKAVTQECLNENLMSIMEGDDQFPTRFYPPGTGEHLIHVQLPQGIKCSQCVVQWRYRTGNSWGRDLDGTECIGCGVQEEFRNCADISIGSGGKSTRSWPSIRGEIVDPLITENNMRPIVKTLRDSKPTFNKNYQTPQVTSTQMPRVRTTPQPEARRLTLDHLWTRTTFLKPRIHIDMSRNRVTSTTPRPKPRISFFEPTTTKSPISKHSSAKNRLMQLRKLQRLAALAIQMKSLLNTLRHLPVFKNLNLGILDEELLGQRDAPWNNLAKPSAPKAAPQSRSFPWRSGMSLSEIKAQPQKKPSVRTRSLPHILSIPSANENVRFNPPAIRPPSALLTAQFRREKTRTVTLRSEEDSNKNATETESYKTQNDASSNITVYKNEFNVISPESLEGETSITDWYKKIVKLMVKKQYPVEEIKKMVERLKQIKDVHKIQPTTMLERIQNSDLPVAESERTEASDNSVVSPMPLQSTSSPETNVVYPNFIRRTWPANADTNMVYPNSDGRSANINKRRRMLPPQQGTRDISAIPPNVNTVRRRAGSRGHFVNNPNVDYAEDNHLTSRKRRPLSMKLRNFLELNPQFRIPFGAIFH